MKNDFTERLTKIETALDKALSMDFTQEWQKSSFAELSPSVKAQYIQNLIQPNRELISLGGKRWRPLLLILSYELSKNFYDNSISEDEAYALTPLVEFVHTASLIHDDIEDSADLRRGKPSAYITYGLDTALNAASWLYFEAPVCLNRINIPDSLRLNFYNLYTNELRRLHLGQAMDIYWHRNKNIFPNQDEYMSMVKCKTGTLASLAAKVGFTAGGAAAEDCEKIGEIAANIGIGFQIIDDVINLTKGNPGKKRGDDIVEGKKSLPVLIHIEKCPEDKEKISALMEQAQKEGINSPAVEECIALLEKSNCITEAAEKGKNLIHKNCRAFAGYFDGCKQVQTLDSEKTASLITDLFDSMIPKDFK